MLLTKTSALLQFLLGDVAPKEFLQRLEFPMEHTEVGYGEEVCTLGGVGCLFKHLQFLENVKDNFDHIPPKSVCAYILLAVYIEKNTT